MKKQFLNTKDVALITGRSIATANRRIRMMNEELEEEGYYTEPGLIPVVVFEEKYKGIKVPDEILEV